jgi:hypothetical protein
VSILRGVKIALHTLESVDLLGIHVLRKVVVVVVSEHIGSLVGNRYHCRWVWLESKR